MNLLRISAIFAALAMLAIPANAQQWYVKAATGYNFSLGSSVLTSNYRASYTYTPNYTTNRYDKSRVITGDDVSGTFGKGLSYSITGGCMLSRVTSLELDVSYYNSTYDSRTYVERSIAAKGIGLQQSIDKQYTGRMLSFTPSAVFSQSSDEGKWRRYFKLGLVLGKGWYNAEIRNYIDDIGTAYDTLREKSYTVSGGLALGITAALGYSTHLDKNTLFFVEASALYLDPAIMQPRLTSYRFNGADYTSRATEADKAMSGEHIADAEADEPKRNDITRLEATPFHSWGIKLGIIYIFHGKKST